MDLQDRADINDALIRYTVAVDTADWAALETVFTPDAHIDYSETGGTIGTFPEVRTWLSENLYAFAKRTMHTLGQVAITPAGEDEARVSAYFHNPMVIADGEAERVVEVGGIYHHTFVRTGAGWRSKDLHEQLVWMRGF